MRHTAALSLVIASLCTSALLAGDDVEDKPKPKYWHITGKVDGRDFRGERFGGATMSGADFSGALLTHADLTACDLRHASFSGADLRNALLTGTRLRLTDFRGTDLRGADFRSSIIEQPMFDGATYDATTRWPLGFNPLRWGARLVPSVIRRRE